MSRARPRAVIFDLDGTLADTIEDIAYAMDAVLAGHGCGPRTLEEYKRFVGNGGRELVLRALPAEKQHLADAVLAEFRAFYEQHLTERTRLYPGIPELLGRLTERGILLAVLSNKAEPATRAIAARLLARWPFREVLGEVRDRPKKPDPAGALLIARKLGVEPAACVLVGDSGNDVRTARAAGMAAVGVLWGYRDRADMEAAAPDALIGAPLELLDVLRGWGVV